MRSAASLNRSDCYRTFPFPRPWRLNRRVSRLIRLLRQRYLSSAFWRLSDVMGWGHAPSRQHCSMLFAVLAIAALLPGCATAPLVQGTGLSSYSELKPSDGKITKSRLHVKKERVASARTINIAPTVFPAGVAPALSAEERALVANVVNRALCVSLSDRFMVVTPDVPADLTVRAAVTHATETNEVAAGVSVATTIGMKFVDTGGIPVPTPRVPIGLGELSIEAEAVDRSGRQQAAMVGAGERMRSSVHPGCRKRAMPMNWRAPSAMTLQSWSTRARVLSKV